jgi:hypothetical protein
LPRPEELLGVKLAGKGAPAAELEAQPPTPAQPLGPEEVGGSSQRVPNAHGRSQNCAAVLEQERNIRRERAR